MKKNTNHPWKVFAAILLAVLFGSWAGQEKTLFGIRYYSILDTFGEIFLKALTLVVVPLVSSSIITGISRIESETSFKRLGGRMFSLYFGTTIISILSGLFIFNLLSPEPFQGVSIGIGQGENIANLQIAAGDGISNLVQVFLDIVPSNVVLAFSPGHMLGLIFFSIFFGFCLSRINSEGGAAVRRFWEGIFQTMIQMTRMVMKFLPLGVFCLVGKVFATTGIYSLASLSYFALTVVLGLAVFMFIMLPILLQLLGNINPIEHFKAMIPSMITGFSTSSTSATLPVTMDCVEKRAGVSNRISGLVIPLGSSFNMSGSALYACVATLFVAKFYGIDLSFETQLLVVAASVVASVGVAGVPSGSLVAVIIVMGIIGLPPEGIGLFIGVDRLIDMFRTVVNVFSNSCCAVLVARLEEEKIYQQA